MNSRNRILKALRADTGQGPPPLPALPDDWPVADDLRAQYGAALEMAGGQLFAAANPEVVTATLEQFCVRRGWKRVASIVPGVDQLRGPTMLDVTSVDDPHDLEDVDLAVVPGRFAVAENGAVWVSGADLRQRALCFTCQHLALVVPPQQMVANMHEAYRRLQVAETAFGVFISGPSKTADIEQALVLGAHGPRSLTVFLMDGPR